MIFVLANFVVNGIPRGRRRKTGPDRLDVDLRMFSYCLVVLEWIGQWCVTLYHKRVCKITMKRA